MKNKKIKKKIKIQIVNYLTEVENGPTKEQSESSTNPIDEILEVEDQELLLPLHGGLLGHQEEGRGMVDIPVDGFLSQLYIHSIHRWRWRYLIISRLRVLPC